MPEADDGELLSVAQAIRVIDAVSVSPRVIRVPLDRSAGLRLAVDLNADRDYPPFQKSLMDGYAVRCADVSSGMATLRVVGTVAAGQSAERELGPGEAMAIMTGAPLPAGADGVVPVEDVAGRVAVGGVVQVLRATSPGRYIAARGSDCTAGHLVLARGTLIGPAQIAVLASIGAAQVDCFACPRVAILGTGDELVPVDQTPAGSQIRDSNTHMLAALLRRLGCEVTRIANVRDDPAQIRDAIEAGMKSDALFITGGMSMGDFDFVPRLLIELGVEMKIAKLRIKPGKPFVFGQGKGTKGPRGKGNLGIEEGTIGQRDEGSLGMDEGTKGGNSTRGAQGLEHAHADSASSRPSSLCPSVPSSLFPSPNPFVFGLPGNPVSAYVCTLRLASRLLTRIAGGNVEERWIDGRLDAGLPTNGPREFYQPALVHRTHGSSSSHAEFAAITPLKWKGSADLFTLAAANALIVRGENEPALPKGTVVRVLQL